MAKAEKKYKGYKNTGEFTESGLPIFEDEGGLFIFSPHKRLPNGTLIYPKKSRCFKMYIERTA